MKTKFTIVFALVLLASTAFGQANFRITYDASLSGAACQPLGASKIYAHSGAGTSGETAIFEVVVGNWGLDDGVGEMTNTGTDMWELDINLYDYYGLVEGSDVIYGIGVVFRNEDGSLEGKDDNCADIAIRGIEAGDITIENLDGSPFAGVTAGFIAVGLNNTLSGVNAMDISPNPATDRAILNFLSTTNKRLDLVITNAMGQQISSQRVTSNQVLIERNNLPAGLYFATLMDEKGGRATQRFFFN